MTMYEFWRKDNPKEYAELLRDDPEHVKMMAQGWSWVEIRGGPKDGGRVYFTGAPRWEIRYADPSTDPEKFKPGDLEHRYILARGDNNEAYYKYTGECRSVPG